MTMEIVETDAYKQMEEVSALMMKGYSEFATARKTGLKVVEVRGLWGMFQERLRDDIIARDAARDHLNMMVEQYNDLIRELNENMDNLKMRVFDEKISAQINATAKNIADLQARRVEMLKNAGLLDDSDLGDELAEREEHERIIVEILQNDLCDRCKAHTLDKVAHLVGTVQTVEGEVIE